MKAESPGNHERLAIPLQVSYVPINILIKVMMCNNLHIPNSEEGLVNFQNSFVSSYSVKLILVSFM